MPQQEFLISADETGALTFIYHDDLAFLMELGHAETKRASHVEPGPDNKWYADMSPVAGPVLGPFDFRQQALDAETKFIKENVL